MIKAIILNLIVIWASHEHQNPEYRDNRELISIKKDVIDSSEANNRNGNEQNYDGLSHRRLIYELNEKKRKKIDDLVDSNNTDSIPSENTSKRQCRSLPFSKTEKECEKFFRFRKKINVKFFCNLESRLNRKIDPLLYDLIGRLYNSLEKREISAEVYYVELTYCMIDIFDYLVTKTDYSVAKFIIELFRFRSSLKEKSDFADFLITLGTDYESNRDLMADLSKDNYSEKLDQIERPDFLYLYFLICKVFFNMTNQTAVSNDKNCSAVPIIFNYLLLNSFKQHIYTVLSAKSVTFQEKDLLNYNAEYYLKTKDKIIRGWKRFYGETLPSVLTIEFLSYLNLDFNYLNRLLNKTSMAIPNSQTSPNSNLITNLNHEINNAYDIEFGISFPYKDFESLSAKDHTKIPSLENRLRKFMFKYEFGKREFLKKIFSDYYSQLVTFLNAHRQ